MSERDETDDFLAEDDHPDDRKDQHPDVEETGAEGEPRPKEEEPLPEKEEPPDAEEEPPDAEETVAKRPPLPPLLAQPDVRKREPQETRRSERTRTMTDKGLLYTVERLDGKRRKAFKQVSVKIDHISRIMYDSKLSDLQMLYSHWLS